MRDVALDDETALLLQVTDNLAVGSLHILALVLGDLGGESTGLIDGARRDLVVSNDTVGHTDSVIVVTPRGCLVDDTSTSVLGDVRVGQDSERPVLKLLRQSLPHSQAIFAD